MRPLIAIVTCHKFKSRANAQRHTWLVNCTYEYKFFLSRGIEEAGPDEIYLDVPDDYKSLPLKVQAMCQWALANGYDTVFKCDDDTYVFPDRLTLPTVLYTGRLNGSNYGICPLGWCSGFAYWLSGEALKIVAEAPTPTDTREDLWVGKTLNAKGIKCINHDGFIAMSIVSPSIWGHFGKRAIAVCEFPDGKMLGLHDLFTNPSRAEELKPECKINPRFGRRVQSQ